MVGLVTDISTSGLRSDFDQILQYGALCRVKYYTETVGGGGSYYDDSTSLTQSGADFYATGLHYHLDRRRGSEDSVLVEQGRLKETDSVLFFRGDVQTSGIMKIGIGSPPGSPTQGPNGYEFEVVGPGVLVPPRIDNAQEFVYKKVYIRWLPLGSFADEL